MKLTDTRRNALIALGQREAEVGQLPGSGPAKGDKCLYIFPGRFSPQIEWCRKQGLVHSGHCMFQYTSSTLTSDGSRMIKPAFCLTPEAVKLLLEGGKTSEEVFGKVQKREDEA